MGFVASLRFDNDSGGIIGDEESWHLRRNKTYINDSVHPLIDSKLVEKYGIDLVYAGAGTPSFHKMVISKSREKIENFLNNSGKKNFKLSDIARIVVKSMNEIHTFWRNNRLKLLFNFSIDDYNSGTFNIDGELYAIENEDVKKKSKKIIESNENGGYHGENNILLIGYDSSGFNSFCIKGNIGVLSYVSCGFDVLGKGVYGSGAQFKDVLENYTLKKRRKGYGKKEGIYALIRGALGSSEYYNESGGNFHITIIDKESQNRRIELKKDRSHLSQEIIRSEMKGLISKKNCLSLLENLIFKNKKIEIIEKEFFNMSENKILLEFFLRGYKLDEELRSFSTILSKGVNNKKVKKGGVK